MPFNKNIAPGNASDHDLVVLYQQSADLKVLAQLFQRYMDLVYGVCLLYLKDPANAQDHTMDIFEELVTKLQKHQVANFKSWLHVLAKNHCLMHLRSEKKNIVLPMKEEFMQNEPEEHLDLEQEKELNFLQLDYCMQQLSPEQKRMIELFYIQGKCYNEIAMITGIEWNKIRSSIQNGRRNLKNCMENQKEKSAVK